MSTIVYPSSGDDSPINKRTTPIIKSISEIPGWFDFHQIYIDAVVHAPQDGAIFVELGSFLGQSTAYMANLIKAS